MTYPWKIEVRAPDLTRVGELDDYQSLDMLLKFNDVSTWQLQVDRANRLAAALVAPGAGIVVSRNGQTILSGTRTNREDRQDDKTDTITLSGVDDTAWLKWRVAHPQPGTPQPPYSTAAEEAATGSASSVLQWFAQRNVGQDALVARRALVTVAHPGYGLTITGRARWQNLLTMMQELAVMGAVDGIPVGFRVVQGATGLQYGAYVPVDRTTTAIFSRGLGNLRALTYRETVPEATYWFVGGAGTGTGRTIFEMPDSAAIAVWGRREGEFVDASTAANAGELQQAAVKAQADSGGTRTLAITPIDTEQLAFGIHYGLGDRVTAVMAPVGGSSTEVVVQDIVRQCRITLTPEAADVVAAVGTDGTKTDTTLTKIFDRLKNLGKRMNDAERG